MCSRVKDTASVYIVKPLYLCATLEGERFFNLLYYEKLQLIYIYIYI